MTKIYHAIYPSVNSGIVETFVQELDWQQVTPIKTLTPFFGKRQFTRFIITTRYKLTNRSRSKISLSTQGKRFINQGHKLTGGIAKRDHSKQLKNERMNLWDRW